MKFTSLANGENPSIGRNSRLHWAALWSNHFPCMLLGLEGSIQWLVITIVDDNRAKTCRLWTVLHMKCGSGCCNEIASEAKCVHRVWVRWNRWEKPTRQSASFQNSTGSWFTRDILLTQGKRVTKQKRTKNPPKYEKQDVSIPLGACDRRDSRDHSYSGIFPSGSYVMHLFWQNCAWILCWDISGTMEGVLKIASSIGTTPSIIEGVMQFVL